MIVLVAFSSDVVERMASAMKISFALVNVVSVWRWVTLVVVMFFALCMMYKFAPHKKLRFKEIIPGTIFSMAGFMLLTVGFSIYVTYFMRGSALYGTIGTVILLMLWMYICLLYTSDAADE